MVEDYPTDPLDVIPYDYLCAVCPYGQQCKITYCPRYECEDLYEEDVLQSDKV